MDFLSPDLTIRFFEILIHARASATSSEYFYLLPRVFLDFKALLNVVAVFVSPVESVALFEVFTESPTIAADVSEMGGAF